MLRSVCCNAPIRDDPGTPDFIGSKEKGITICAICTKCGQACGVANGVRKDKSSVRIKELADVVDYVARQLRKLSKEVEDEQD